MKGSKRTCKHLVQLCSKKGFQLFNCNTVDSISKDRKVEDSGQIRDFEQSLASTQGQESLASTQGQKSLADMRAMFREWKNKNKENTKKPWYHKCEQSWKDWLSSQMKPKQMRKRVENERTKYRQWKKKYEKNTKDDWYAEHDRRWKDWLDQLEREANQAQSFVFSPRWI